MAYIYKIQNLINGKIYIGKTTFSIQQRWKKHISTALQNSNYPLHKAIRKYGINNFSIEKVEEVSLSEINEKEIFWIKKYNSFISNNQGYNAT